MSFRTQSGDAFATISVEDRLGVPVPVEVTQWNRHGASVGDPVVYCGGISELFPLDPSSVRIEVSVEEGDCGGNTISPEGGVSEVVFHAGR